MLINAICRVLNINKDWLIEEIGEIEDNSEASRSAKILAELYEMAKDLSEENSSICWTPSKP